MHVSFPEIGGSGDEECGINMEPLLLYVGEGVSDTSQQANCKISFFASFVTSAHETTLFSGA